MSQSGGLDVDATLREAHAALEQGNPCLVSTLSEMVLESGHRPPLALSLLGLVGLAVREYKRAMDLLREVQTMTPGDVHLKQHLDMAKKLAREQALQRPDGRKRFLVIKPWGYGFCSDLDHVLGCLLLAEMTARIPIVYWGAGSRFRHEADDNAWPRFFEPVSKYTLADVAGKGLSWFPPKWNDTTIHEPEVNKMVGEFCRMGGILFFNRREDVAVSDMHIPVYEVASWLRAGTPLAGKPVDQIYRHLVKKYLKPAAAITSHVDDFAAKNFTTPVIAAHVRGSDKLVEDSLLKEKNQDTPAIIQKFLADKPAGRVFLLTDDEKVKAEYAARFGDRMITTECLRTSTAKGLHYTEQPSRSRLGVEVMVDMYLAARCDAFVGVGTSNVAAMIEHLKDWPSGTLTILSPSIHYIRNPFLHRWELPPEKIEHIKRIEREQQERERASGSG
jgi:hypothetical protein